jgi:pyridoxal phosphate enzyme (YggS family)
VALIAVSKGFGPDAVRAAIDAGIEDIGENRVQEATAKRAELGDTPGIRWHMIGHLQANKVNVALRTFDIIHSVDSLHLAQAISHRAPAEVPVFIEVIVANEPTKTGVDLGGLRALHEQITTLPLIAVQGLMTVAPMGASAVELRRIFERLRCEGEKLGSTKLSMGMSDDYEIAIEEGATHVRVGRAIFGERPV